MVVKMPEKKNPVGRPSSRKALLTLRLEPEVVQYYREVGQANAKGWLQEVNDTLKRSMQKRQQWAARQREAAE
jgi:uncharacterized protein (DUF4415 family)